MRAEEREAVPEEGSAAGSSDQVSRSAVEVCGFRTGVAAILPDLS